jgi:hypothetical protein
MKIGVGTRFCSIIFVTASLFYVGNAAGQARNISVFPLNQVRGEAKDLLFKSIFPNFDQNYLKLQEKCKKAKNIPRIDMPVIRTGEIAKFRERISNGFIDIRPPYSKKHKKDPVTGEYIYFPKDLKADERGKQWLTLGKDDGSIDDDKVVARMEYVAVKDLFPTQSQIWLAGIIRCVNRWGIPVEGSKLLEMTIIISKDNYVIDGHHRFSTTLLVNPDLEIKVFRIELEINTLLKMSRSYGNAIGNLQNR